MARRVTRNLLTNRKATVSLSRNGLVVEVGDVSAPDAAVVAQCLLNAFRQLENAGYHELTFDAGVFHADGHAIPEELDDEDWSAPVEMQAKSPKLLGFR